MVVLDPSPFTDLVTVQVPRSRLTEVYALLGAPPSNDKPAKPAGDDSDWVEAFSWIVKDQRPSFVRIGAMLDTLASIAPGALALDAIGQRTGLTVSELRGALTGFGRSITSTYGEPEAPWVRTWGPISSPNQDGQYHYSIDVETAEAWLAARKRA